MKRFLKNNLVLLIVLGIAVFIGIGLLVLVILAHTKMYVYVADAEKLRADISKINKQRPTPVEGNLEPIKQRIQLLTQKTTEAQSYFCDPKAASLKKFVAALAMTTDEAGIAVRTSWARTLNRTQPDGFTRFRNSLREQYPHWGDALRKLTEVYAKEIQAEVDEETVEEQLLAAWKVGRVSGNDVPEKKADAPALRPVSPKLLDQFVANLALSTEEFKEKFRTEWEADNNRTALGGRDRFYQRFKRNYPTWDRALEAFQKSYQPETIEIIDDTNVDEILLAALGVPRNMANSPDRAFNYILKMSSRMIEVFNQSKQEMIEEKEAKAPKDAKGNEDLAEQDPEFHFFGNAAEFSFDRKAPPRVEDISKIATNWEVIGDIGRRISKSGISSLNAFSKRTIAGETNGNFQLYHYTFTVSGSLESVRNLVKILNDAYKDHRIYIVRSVFLYADTDGAKTIFLDRAADAERLRQELDSTKKDAKESAAQNQDTPPDMPGMPGMPDMPGEKKPVVKAAPIDYSKLPYDKRPGYGKTMFGGKLSCEAVIDVDYVCLVQPELN